MRKFFRMAVFTAAALLLAACSEDNNEPFTPETPEEAEPAIEETDSICRADKRVVWFHEDGGVRNIELEGIKWVIEEVTFFNRVGNSFDLENGRDISRHEPELDSHADFIWSSEWLSISWEDSQLTIIGESFESEEQPIYQTAAIVMKSAEETDTIFVARQITSPAKFDYFYARPDTYQVAFDAAGGEQYVGVQIPCELESVEVSGNYLGSRPTERLDYPYSHQADWLTFSCKNSKGFSLSIKPNTTGDLRACNVRLYSQIWQMSVIIRVEQAAE